MKDPDIAKVVAHVIDSWPLQKLPSQSPALWRDDFALVDYECMIEAVDRLRRSDERMPTTARLLETWKAVHVGAGHPLLGPQQANPTDFPESPYLRESKKLIYSERGRRVMMLPIDRLTPDEVELRKKVIDAAKRHEVIMLNGGRPDQEMLAEVITLAAMLEMLPEPPKSSGRTRRKKTAVPA